MVPNKSWPFRNSASYTPWTCWYRLFMVGGMLKLVLYILSIYLRNAWQQLVMFLIPFCFALTVGQNRAWGFYIFKQVIQFKKNILKGKLVVFSHKLYLIFEIIPFYRHIKTQWPTWTVVFALSSYHWFDYILLFYGCALFHFYFLWTSIGLYIYLSLLDLIIVFFGQKYSVMSVSFPQLMGTFACCVWHKSPKLKD